LCDDKDIRVACTFVGWRKNKTLGDSRKQVFVHKPGPGGGGLLSSVEAGNQTGDPGAGGGRADRRGRARAGGGAVAEAGMGTGRADGGGGGKAWKGASGGVGGRGVSKWSTPKYAVVLRAYLLQTDTKSGR
jgi:hypothetical protein